MELKKDLVTPPNPKTLDREIWNAIDNYKCLCCNDTGYVVRVERVLKSHSIWSRPILCKRVGCHASNTIQDGNDVCDSRLTREECQELHNMAVEDWQETMRNEHQRRQELLREMANNSLKKIP